jgi:predicted DNA-binding transcriptional regulator AlpA
MKEKLLTTREVSQILGLNEQDIIDLAKANLLPSFKVAGEFLRFRKDDILRVKENIKNKYNLPERKYKGWERFKEFIYFNDFYIISTAVIAVLLWLVVRDLLP